ncbi:MAG: VWA domain-containing protein [candidate division KSB1 bacterium]|nr:VWA domain-containing protein [candidate division KSB1 bacterium]
MLRFANPEFLLLLLAVPAMIYGYIRRHRAREGGATLRYSNLGLVKKAGSTARKKYRHSLFVFRVLTVIFLVIVLARPQSGQKETEVHTEGVDIILAMDISSSMRAEDFKPKNRLEAAKIVATDFIQGRQNDRIGLVVFAAQSFTQCPLTLDYGILLQFLEKIEIGLIDDGTAIGMALGNCVNRLRNSKAKSKVIILLTDGRNNRGELDPQTAAKVAEAYNLKIYTIGVGKRGEALYPVQDPVFGKRYVRMPVQIDEELLEKIASTTGGRYFRATDKTSLEQIFDEIDQLEKTKIEVKEYTRYRELFIPFLLAALGLILLEIVLANTVFRKIP